MHWILQNNLFNEDAYQVLLETLQRQGIPHSVHKVIPFIGELTEPEAPVVDGPVVCMGSYSLRHAARKHGWVPGVWDLEPFDYREQRKHWGSHMLNADSVVSRFEDVKWPQVSLCSAHRTKNADCEMCRVYSADLEQAFVRPVADSKVFAGTLFGKDEFLDWQRKVCVLEEDYGTSLTKDTLVQLAWPKTIYAEYRFWIVKGQIVCASLYKRGSKVIYSPVDDERLFSYVRRRIDEWCPADAFCIDICEIPNLHAVRYSSDELPWIKIMEIGTLNSCGFYAANIPKLVNALEDAFN